jgi:hypothetical protein
LPESVTVNVSGVALAAAVGVPLIAPALNDRPAGRVPLVRAQVYGVVPPVAARVALYAVPTCPLGSEVVVIVNGGGATVRVASVFAPQPFTTTAASDRVRAYASAGNEIPRSQTHPETRRLRRIREPPFPGTPHLMLPAT